MNKIFIPPIDASNYRDNNLDPQQTTSKEPHRSILYLDSQDCTQQTDKVNINFSTIKSPTDTEGLLCTGISRFKIETISLNFISPNVNTRNNTIQFDSTPVPGPYIVTLNEGFYPTVTDLLDEVIAAMNTVSGTSLVTFSYTIIPGFPNKYTLDSAGGTYSIDPFCSAVLFGSQLYGLPVNSVYQNSKIGGSVSLFYTKYIDVCSNIISKYEKIRTVATNLNYNILVRIYLDSGGSPQYINYHNTPDISYNFLPSEPIYRIDMSLRDQFGDLLYIPSPEYGFNWGISLIIEY